MKNGIPSALLLAILLHACTTPQNGAPPPAASQPSQPVAAPEVPPAPPPSPELSAALRAALNDSGAALADGPEGSLRLTLPGAIAFASGSRAVSEPAMPILNRIAAALRTESNWRMRIEGHTDSVGRELFNEELSLQRAEAVRDYLAKQGLDARRSEAAGRGEHMPIADNGTAKGRAANRRIEIIITPVAE